MYEKGIMQYRLDNHLCTRCGEPAVPRKKMCIQHLEETRLKEKKKRERRKNNNICVRCGQRSPRSGKTQCSVCANDNKDQYNAAKMDIYYQRRSSNNCVRCGKYVNNFSVHCDICAEYMKYKDQRYYNATKKSGLCVHCRKTSPIVNEILCLICKKKNAICGKDNRIKQKLTIIQHYGGKCMFCGETDMIVLSIDHIDGDGTKHRKQLRNQGTILYRWLIKNNYPTGFQVLCFNCNFRKYLNGGICPNKDRQEIISK